jgi:hypothetical protein
MKTRITLTKTITPQSSFVKQITLLGKDKVLVELQNKKIYHYNVTPQIVKEIKRRARRNQSMGAAFNELLRGDSVAKTTIF